MSITKYPHGVLATPNIGADLAATFASGNVWFVDGDVAATSDGTSPDSAFKTIQEGITAAVADGGVVYIKARDMAATASDPVSYAETLIIPAGSSRMALIGCSSNWTQGGLPQIKKGSGSAALLAVKSPGCLIANLGFNGSGSTGGGVVLYDDGGSTTASFGTRITGCHFKNCKGSTATDSRTGGAIMLGSVSGDNAPWQVRIDNNTFYKNVGDVVLIGTGAVPQDIIICDNTFMGTAAAVDCHIYLATGSGVAPVAIYNNMFADVLPALGSGSVVRYVDLTSCTGIFANNYFAGSYTTTGFGAAKVAAKIATTVGIAHNYSDAGLIVREA